MSANRNKESIELDLKSDDGRAVMQRLVRRADVLIENFRPGTMDRLDFAAALEELNPVLSFCPSADSATTARKDHAQVMTRSPRAKRD